VQLQLKTILNQVQRLAGFIYQEIELFAKKGHPLAIKVKIAAHEGRPGRCSRCLKPASGYDRLRARRWLHEPVWGIPVYFYYTPRRVKCAEHGVVVEHMPWNVGKRPYTRPMMCFLAHWARRLSWRETARCFQTSWEAVYRSVQWFVQWGLAHRKLEGVTALGLDEIHWGQGKRSAAFLTVIYQIDSGCRRLLWVGPKRTQATLKRGLQALGPEVVKGLKFVCSDMWKPYLQVIAKQANQAVHVLDRFHITQHLNKAVDEVRRGESSRLRAAGKAKAEQLKRMRWKLLRRGRLVRGRTREKLLRLFWSKLATGRAWQLKESFEDFWRYRHLTWARTFLEVWCARAMRSRLEPMRRVARMLRAHEELILNWFRAKGEISSGAVEGLNNKIRVVTRRSYGFRTYKAMEVALYHTLGRLPEPPPIHSSC
jgi:transposase